MSRLPSISKARAILGDQHFDFCVQQGAEYCLRRAKDSWQAEEDDMHGAFLAASDAADNVSEAA